MSTNNECSAVARLGAESLRQTKMTSEKSAKTSAVLDFNTQSQGLALEGAQRQDSTKPPHTEWNAPPSNKERDSHAGTQPKQRYDRWDGPQRHCHLSFNSNHLHVINTQLNQHYLSTHLTSVSCPISLTQVDSHLLYTVTYLKITYFLFLVGPPCLLRLPIFVRHPSVIL